MAFSPSVFLQNNCLWEKTETDFVAVVQTLPFQPPSNITDGKLRQGGDKWLHMRKL